MKLQDFIDTQGTGKTFMISTGAYGYPVEVYCIGERLSSVCLGYRDQTVRWVDKFRIREITETIPPKEHPEYEQWMDNWLFTDPDGVHSTYEPDNYCLYKGYSPTLAIRSFSRSTFGKDQ